MLRRLKGLYLAGCIWHSSEWKQMYVQAVASNSNVELHFWKRKRGTRGEEIQNQETMMSS